MTSSKNTAPPGLAQAVEAIDRLTRQRLNDIFSGGQSAALAAHTEIGVKPVSQKCSVFYRYFLPLVSEAVSVFAENYRRYFKLALAHPIQAGNDPDQWAWNQLQPPLYATFDWIPEWFIVACDGENRYVRRVGSAEFVAGQTLSLSLPLNISPTPPPAYWRAPAWLFQIGPFVGITLVKQKHVPVTDSEEKLSAAHTRLLLKGARRMFLMALGTPIENVRNEETAAAGAIATHSAQNESSAGKRRSTKPRPKGFEGLRKQRDLSQYDQYMDGLTEKQRMALSLRLEYGCRPAEIAVRMGISRKTAWEHFQAAQAKINQLRSNDKHKTQRSKRGSE